MLKIIVDSASSIKNEEKEQYGVELLPLRVIIDGQEYLDGVNLNLDEFYEKLKTTKEFPKTSLPSLEYASELVEGFLAEGARVLIITLSSGISGTYQVLKALFAEKEDVLVYDSRFAVGIIRFMVQEAKKYEDESFEVITEKLDALRERAEIVAVPETLDYLLAGGRLSKAGWMAGKLLSICPIIGFEDGKVVSIEKKRGKQQAINYMVNKVETDGVDPEYGLIAAYSYNKANIDEVLGQTSPEITKYLVTYDHISPTIGSHFGPNAFGYYYIKK